jgi:hypothetical protein
VAVILAYKVTGLITIGGIRAVDKGAGARGNRALGLSFIGLVYMPLI